jgi:hypothetical protein
VSTQSSRSTAILRATFSESVRVTSPSIEDALKLSQVTEMNWDGHAIKKAFRTKTGADLKSFCNLKLTIVIGEEGSPSHVEYMRMGSTPITCWKCNDRKASS